MAEYASKGVAGAGLGTGIAGLSLGVLNSGLLNGVFGANNGWANNGNWAYPVCSESIPVNRYEAAQSARIAELETEVKLRDANIYTDSKLNDLRNYVERKFDHVEHELCDQKVFNAGTISNIGCIQGQIAQLYGLTKLIVPNSAICPGWGDVTVSVTPAAAAGA